MAAPNLYNITTITGKTVPYAATNTLATTGVENAASSGKLLRVNCIVASNILGSSAVNLSVSLYRASTHYYIASTIPVPANASLVVLGKSDGGIMLEEGDKLYALASANSAIDLLVSYDEIS